MRLNTEATFSVVEIREDKQTIVLSGCLASEARELSDRLSRYRDNQGARFMAREDK